MAQKQGSPACGCMIVFAVGGAIVGLIMAPATFGGEGSVFTWLIFAAGGAFGGMLLGTWIAQKMRL